MAGEYHRGKEKSRGIDWLGRALAVTCLPALIMTPTAYYLDSEAAAFNPGIAYEPESEPIVERPPTSHLYDEITGLTRDTGMDTQPCQDFKVCGTDVAHPFLLQNGSVAYLFGDTFAVEGPFLKDVPAGEDHYRAQSILFSNMTPTEGQPLIFDSAAGLEGKGIAPEILGGWHMLMNDGISLPDGRIIISYQHTVEVDDQEDHTWQTDRSSLAVSYDGGHNFELTGPDWWNDDDNSDPYQMMSMQLDGDYVYAVSVRTGRQPGPMMLMRSRWDQMMESTAYEYWNGSAWGDKAEATPLQEGHFGEPSLRKLSDDTWVLSYADYTGYPKIVTRTITDPAQGPEGKWSQPKVQLTARELPNLYGGGIHPYSTKDNLTLMISTWQTKGKAEAIQDRELVRYDVSHLNTTT